MQPIEIFKIGTHTAMAGQTLDFSRDSLAAAVAAYAPATHEAPIVVGHPKDNHPAFGWIDHLELTADGVVLAHPKQVDAEFAELVKEGRYKKRSASWYLPDSPANPSPGTLYLRHVGFLGAQPPALKGLGDVQFNESEQGVVEFGDSSPWAWDSLARMMRRWREKIIAKDGIEIADQELPSYEIEILVEEAKRLRQEQEKSESQPSFTEGQDMSATPPVTPPAQTAEFAEQLATLAKRERDLSKREIGNQLDDLIKTGKVLPAHKVGLVEFMATLDDADQTVEFGEGTAAVKQSPRQFMQAFLSGLPKVIDFAERSKEDGAGTEIELTAAELATKAQAYHAKQTAAGQHVSFSEAVAVVQAGKDRE
jgi:hypothetical protein